MNDLSVYSGKCAVDCRHIKIVHVDVHQRNSLLGLEGSWDWQEYIDVFKVPM